jgi:hypothetical protein
MIRTGIRIFQQNLFLKRSKHISSPILRNRISKYLCSEIKSQETPFSRETEPIYPGNNHAPPNSNNFSVEFQNEFIKEGRNPRHVGWWLLLTSLGVLGMILIGGYTRLSKSGLSMVRWKPVDPHLPK